MFYLPMKVKTMIKFIKRKASWITADEMAICGIEDLMGTFPNK